VISGVVSGNLKRVDEPRDVPPQALLMTQFRRLAGLLHVAGVDEDDLVDELRLVCAGVRAGQRSRLRVVPTAG
jgi:hypothetical protein